MKRNALILLTFSALVACKGNGTPKAPTGQVAATAAGQEITTSDVKMEMGAIANDPQLAARAQPAALQAIVNRKLLAAAATERGIEKSPAAAMQLARARDLALISMLQQSIAARAPKPSVDEANIYIRDNPQSFAQRKLVAVDQIIVPQIAPNLIKQMEPMTKLEQITALLDTNKVPYRLGGAVVDTAAIPPEPAKQIGNMALGFVFLTPAGGGVQVSRVTGSRPAPLTGQAAVEAAQQVLFNRRASDLIRIQFENIIKAGQSKVSINPAFRAPAASNSPPAAQPAR